RTCAMLRAILCALLVVAGTSLGAQEPKQPQAPRPVGLEYRLWSSNWLARGQYRFSDYASGAFSFATTRSCTGCPSAASSPLNVSFQVPMMQHLFEIGIAYQF